MAIQSSSRDAMPALFNQFPGPPQSLYSSEMSLPHHDQMNMIPAEDDVDIDNTSNDLSSSSRKRSGDALAYPRKRATIAVTSFLYIPPHLL